MMLWSCGEAGWLGLLLPPAKSTICQTSARGQALFEALGIIVTRQIRFFSSWSIHFRGKRQTNHQKYQLVVLCWKLKQVNATDDCVATLEVWIVDGLSGEMAFQLKTKWQERTSLGKIEGKEDSR